MLQLRYVFPQICAQIINRRFRYYPHTGVRIEALAMTIKSDFEPTSLDIWQRIRQSGVRTMQPHWHFGRQEIRAARRNTKKEDFLLGHKYPLC